VTGFSDLSTPITLNDIEPSKEGFSMNFSQFLTAAHISTVNCAEIAENRPRQPAYEIFSTKRRFLKSRFRPSWFKEAGAGGVKDLESP